MKLEDRRGKPEVEEDAGGEIKLRWQPAFLAVAGGRGWREREKATKENAAGGKRKDAT